jgi:transcriptional regulator
MTTSRATFESLVDGVVAFRVHVRTVTSNFKLSQDMPADVRARVRADLPDEVADLMPD